MEEIGDVQYCVTTLIDLQGFSSHLEIAAYDMRTNIGQQAIKRLQILEDSLKLVKTEGVRAKQYHPTRLHLQRLNDSLFVAMDLPEFLKPSMTGYSGDTLLNSVAVFEFRGVIFSFMLKEGEKISKVSPEL